MDSGIGTRRLLWFFESRTRQYPLMQVNVPYREQPGFRTSQPAGKEQPEEFRYHQMPVRDFRAQTALICFCKETPEFIRGYKYAAHTAGRQDNNSLEVSMRWSQCCPGTFENWRTTEARKQWFAVDSCIVLEHQPVTASLERVAASGYFAAR